MSERIEEIRQRATAATEGPWEWYGNTATDQVYLATRYGGRVFIIQPHGEVDRGYYRHTEDDAERITEEQYERLPWSEQDEWEQGRLVSTELRFQHPRGLVSGHKQFARYEVLNGQTRSEAGLDERADRSNSPLYREDFIGLAHPDAEFIASAREDIDFLLAEVDRLSA